jgi:hypothetical protein
MHDLRGDRGTTLLGMLALMLTVALAAAFAIPMALAQNQAAADIVHLKAAANDVAAGLTRDAGRAGAASVDAFLSGPALEHGTPDDTSDDFASPRAYLALAYPDAGLRSTGPLGVVVGDRKSGSIALGLVGSAVTVGPVVPPK